MLGRVVGLLLGLVLMGGAYAILDPGGLEGRIPPIALGAFESVREGLALAAGLLGLTIVAAALAGAMRKPEPPPPPTTFRFEDDLAQTPAAEATWRDLPADESPFHLEGAQAQPEALAEPAPFPFDQPETAAEPELAAEASEVPPPVTDPGPAVVAPPPQASVEPEPTEAPTEPTFVAAREALHTRARAEDWSGAAEALKSVQTLAATRREQMLAAQDAGDFARSQGRHDEAVEAYEQALICAREAGSRDELSDALINSGDMACEEHRLDAAVAAYDEAVALRREIAQTGGVEARRRLALALERLADAREDRGHRTRALDLYRESAALLAGLAEDDAERFGADLTSARQRLAELEARVLA